MGINGSLYGPGSVTLSATDTASIYWYDAATGGNLLGSGSSFTSPFINASTIYYAIAGDVCPSAAIPVQAEIFTVPVVDLWKWYGAEYRVFHIGCRCRFCYLCLDNYWNYRNYCGEFFRCLWCDCYRSAWMYSIRWYHGNNYNINWEYWTVWGRIDVSQPGARCVFSSASKDNWRYGDEYLFYLRTNCLSQWDLISKRKNSVYSYWRLGQSGIFYWRENKR